MIKCYWGTRFFCSYLGIVKMDHGAVILDHVDLLNAGDVVD